MYFSPTHMTWTLDETPIAVDRLDYMPLQTTVLPVTSTDAAIPDDPLRQARTAAIWIIQRHTNIIKV